MASTPTARFAGSVASVLGECSKSLTTITDLLRNEYENLSRKIRRGVLQLRPRNAPTQIEEEGPGDHPWSM